MGGGAYYGLVGGSGDTQPWLQQGDGRELKASEQGREQEFFFWVKLLELWVPAIAGTVDLKTGFFTSGRTLELCNVTSTRNQDTHTKSRSSWTTSVSPESMCTRNMKIPLAV